MSLLGVSVEGMACAMQPQALASAHGALSSRVFEWAMTNGFVPKPRHQVVFGHLLEGRVPHAIVALTDGVPLTCVPTRAPSPCRMRVCVVGMARASL